MARHRTENHELQELRELVAWVGEHIVVRSAGMSKATKFCALCSGVTKLRRGACRHFQIWDIAKKLNEEDDRRWDEAFAKEPEKLERLAKNALEEYAKAKA